MQANGLMEGQQVKILERMAIDGLWQYRVECEGQAYRQALENGQVREWFLEADLDAVA